MISIRKQKSNPCYYICSRIREFESLQLKTLFSDCQELYAELQTIHKFCDDARVSDAIEVLLELFLDQEEHGVLNFCRYILILFAPVVKSYIGDSSEVFPQLIFDYTNQIISKTVPAFCNKYGAEDIIQDIGDSDEKGDSIEDSSVKICRSRIITTPVLTPKYKEAFSDSRFMTSYCGLISEYYANILIAFDGRTNINWLPECLPIFEDEYALISKDAQNSISNLLEITLFPMVMALDDDFYHQLLTE